MTKVSSNNHRRTSLPLQISRLLHNARYAACFALICTLASLLAAILVGCHEQAGSTEECASSSNREYTTVFSLADVPEYKGEPSVVVNNNIPFFSEEELNATPFEHYSALDSLGRCGQAYAIVSTETMPTASRGSIGMIRPSGWRISKYDWIEGGCLFNRCHLIAFALAGENDNQQNLITGTRYLNAEGMLPYEEQVANYVRRTDNHVLYRVTPVFEGDNLVATGVLMEAESIEDCGEGIRFCAWCYNVEPGVEIDYATGNNWASGLPYEAERGSEAGGPQADGSEQSESDDSQNHIYILNTSTKRFHLPTCDSVLHMKEKNKQEFEGTRDEVIELGYKPCGSCNP